MPPAWIPCPSDPSASSGRHLAGVRAACLFRVVPCVPAAAVWTVEHTPAWVPSGTGAGLGCSQHARNRGCAAPRAGCCRSLLQEDPGSDPGDTKAFNGVGGPVAAAAVLLGTLPPAVTGAARAPCGRRRLAFGEWAGFHQLAFWLSGRSGSRWSSPWPPCTAASRAEGRASSESVGCGSCWRLSGEYHVYYYDCNDDPLMLSAG